MGGAWRGKDRFPVRFGVGRVGLVLDWGAGGVAGEIEIEIEIRVEI